MYVSMSSSNNQVKERSIFVRILTEIVDNYYCFSGSHPQLLSIEVLDEIHLKFFRVLITKEAIRAEFRNVYKSTKVFSKQGFEMIFCLRSTRETSGFLPHLPGQWLTESNEGC